MREGLCHNLSLKPFRGGRKIAIIQDADFLNAVYQVTPQVEPLVISW
jgi:hypothetical protein